MRLDARLQPTKERFEDSHAENSDLLRRVMLECGVTDIPYFRGDVIPATITQTISELVAIVIALSTRLSDIEMTLAARDIADDLRLRE